MQRHCPEAGARVRGLCESGSRPALACLLHDYHDGETGWK